jgi:hypothetical protein
MVFVSRPVGASASAINSRLAFVGATTQARLFGGGPTSPPQTRCTTPRRHEPKLDSFFWIVQGWLSVYLCGWGGGNFSAGRV